MPAVSIITSFDNPDLRFHEMAATVFQQSFQEWEWIIVDQCSGDGDLLATVREDRRVRFLQSIGTGNPRSLAAAEAHGEYLAFLPADELYAPTAIEKWFWYLESHPQYGKVSCFQITSGTKQQFSRGEGVCMVRREAYLSDGEPGEHVPAGIIPEVLTGIRGDQSARLPEGKSRLLIVVPHLAMGGSDKYVLDLIRELIPRHAFHITVVATGRGPHPWRDHFEALTPDVFTADTFLLFKDIPRFLSYLIQSRRSDSVLVTHSELGYRLLPELRAQNPGVHFYDYVHIEEPDWKCGGYPAMSLARRSFLDHTATSSKHLKDWMIARGADAQNVSVVTTNVDTDSWRRDRYDAESLRLKWNVRPGVPLILFAGRLSAQKQPDVLGKTLELLHQRGVPYCCLIAGGGELEPWLAEFLRKKSIEEARLIGPQSNEAIRELLAISDILFLPSKHEGIALTIYEAMAMGVVPVSADVGGQAELVTPECGVLMSPGPREPERYAEALDRLLADGKLRARVAAAARDRVEKYYRIEQMGDAMAAMLLSQRDVARDTTGNSAAIPWPEPPRPRVPIRETFAMLAPLLIGRPHREDRRLFLQILRQSHLRRKLLEAFDGNFYCSEYPDVPRLFPLALLHYIFFGYREGRLPSASFDAQDFALRFPEAQEINPLLFLIARDPSYWAT